MRQYAVDNNGRFPFHGNDVAQAFLILTNGNYLAPGRIYTCPSDNRSVRDAFVSPNLSYAYVAGLGQTSTNWPLLMDRGIEFTKKSQPAVEILGRGWAEDSPHQTGGNVLFVDGHAEFMKRLPDDPGLRSDPGVANAVALFPK